jgi:hypothetical protein
MYLIALLSGFLPANSLFSLARLAQTLTGTRIFQ